MGLWAGIKYALNSSLGTDNFLPLDELFEKKTGVRIQTINMTLAQSGKTYYADIAPVDTSKSIALITSFINGTLSINSATGKYIGITSVNVWFNSSSQIAASYTYTSGNGYSHDVPITVTVIEFGATVDKG